MTKVRMRSRQLLHFPVVFGLAMSLSLLPANAVTFVISDLLVFTTRDKFLTNNGQPNGPPMDAATFLASERCGGPLGPTPGILLCFAFPETSNTTLPPIQVPGVVVVHEANATPPGPNLSDFADFLTLPPVPETAPNSNLPGNTIVQLTEPGSTPPKLSDRLDMFFVRAGRNRRKADFAFWSDPATEPTVAPDSNFPIMPEKEGEFMDLSGNLFPGLGGAGQPALPYRVWVLSDCGSTTQQVCTAPQAINAIPEPSTLTLFSAGTLGLLGYAWRRRKKAA